LSNKEKKKLHRAVTRASLHVLLINMENGEGNCEKNDSKHALCYRWSARKRAIGAALKRKNGERTRRCMRRGAAFSEFLFFARTPATVS